MRKFFYFGCTCFAVILFIGLIGFFQVTVERRNTYQGDKIVNEQWYFGVASADLSVGYNAFTTVGSLPVIAHASSDFIFTTACETFASSISGIDFDAYLEFYDQYINDSNFYEYHIPMFFYLICWFIPLFIILGIIFLVGDIFIKSFI